MSNTALDRLYALAGMAQAAQLCLLLSHRGICTQPQFITQAQSLLVLDPTSVHAIYGNPQNLHLGFLFVKELAHQPWKNLHTQTGKLMQAFLYLGRKILINPKLQKKLRDQLKRIDTQSKYFGSLEHHRVLHNLADLFLELAGQYKFQLQIAGKKEFLQDPEAIARIRVLLFSGVRAAVLWYQTGGNIVRFLFDRSFILQEVKKCA